MTSDYFHIHDTASPLARELIQRAVDYRSCQRLEALGVPGGFVAELNARCLLGSGRVTVARGRWEVPGPDARLLIGVTEFGHLCDIAAVSTSAPDQVALRTGAGAVLGDDALMHAQARVLAGRHVRLRLFADPLAWLIGRGEGVCVLDWTLALPRLRDLGEAVTIETTPELALVLRERMARGGLPLVEAGPPDSATLRRLARSYEVAA
jgi:hypothetical protein